MLSVYIESNSILPCGTYTISQNCLVADPKMPFSNWQSLFMRANARRRQAIFENIVSVGFSHNSSVAIGKSLKSFGFPLNPLIL